MRARIHPVVVVAAVLLLAATLPTTMPAYFGHGTEPLRRTGPVALTIPAVLPRAPGDTIPAYPGAQGWGATAFSVLGQHDCRTRPLRVVFVTNTSQSGDGSFHAVLQDSLSNSHFNFVLFRTGGMAPGKFQETQISGEGCVYVAGQTAPGDGFALQGRNVRINGGTTQSDIVIRYLRIRGHPDPNTTEGRFYVQGNSGSRHIMFDHNSISWSDGNGGPMLFTLNDSTGGFGYALSMSRNLVAESQESGGGGRGMYYFSRSHQYELGMYANLMVSNNIRNPQTWVGNRVARPSQGVEVVNNFAYNWGSQMWIDEANPGVVDHVKNYQDNGPWNGPNYFVRRMCFNVGSGSPCTNDDVGVPGADSLWLHHPSLYIEGDTIVGAAFNSQWAMMRQLHHTNDTLPWVHEGDTLRREWRLDLPTWPWTEIAASAVPADVLADVGANMRVNCDGTWTANIDPADSLFIWQATNGAGRTSNPDSTYIANTTPTYDAGTPCTDADNDGIPATWEAANGLSDSDATDAYSDGDGDGWWALEEYLALCASGVSCDPNVFTNADGTESASITATYYAGTDSAILVYRFQLLTDTFVFGGGADTAIFRRPSSDSVPFGTIFDLHPFCTTGGGVGLVSTQDTLTVGGSELTPLDSGAVTTHGTDNSLPACTSTAVEAAKVHGGA